MKTVTNAEEVEDGAPVPGAIRSAPPPGRCRRRSSDPGAALRVGEEQREHPADPCGPNTRVICWIDSADRVPDLPDAAPTNAADAVPELRRTEHGCRSVRSCSPPIVSGSGVIVQR